MSEPVQRITDSGRSLDVSEFIADKLAERELIYWCGEKMSDCADMPTDYTGPNKQCRFYHINAAKIADDTGVLDNDSAALWQHIEREIQELGGALIIGTAVVLDDFGSPSPETQAAVIATLTQTPRPLPPMLPLKKPLPSKDDILRAIAAAVEEFDQSDLPHQEIEVRYEAESGACVVHVMQPHNVDIYTLEVKYYTSFSG